MFYLTSLLRSCKIAEIDRLVPKEEKGLILDEINNAVKLKLVDLPQVLDIIKRKPTPTLLHLVLTGRAASPEII